MAPIVCWLGLMACIHASLVYGDTPYSRHSDRIYWDDVNDEDTRHRAVGAVGNYEQEKKTEPLNCTLNKVHSDYEKKFQSLTEKYKNRLSEEGIELIMAYTTHPCAGDFYKDLNMDCREHGRHKGKYPATKEILREAIINISEPWLLLYRRERYHSGYEKFETPHVLEQFTSTSTSPDAFNCSDCPMSLHFDDVSGASINDFSAYEEEREVLLPPWSQRMRLRRPIEWVNDTIRIELTGGGVPLLHDARLIYLAMTFLTSWTLA